MDAHPQLHMEATDSTLLHWDDLDYMPLSEQLFRSVEKWR